jgi:hypothetical protein
VKSCENGRQAGGGGGGGGVSRAVVGVWLLLCCTSHLLAHPMQVLKHITGLESCCASKEGGGISQAVGCATAGTARAPHKIAEVRLKGQIIRVNLAAPPQLLD